MRVLLIGLVGLSLSMAFQTETTTNSKEEPYEYILKTVNKKILNSLQSSTRFEDYCFFDLYLENKD